MKKRSTKHKAWGVLIIIGNTILAGIDLLKVPINPILDAFLWTCLIINLLAFSISYDSKPNEQDV